MASISWIRERTPSDVPTSRCTLVWNVSADFERYWQSLSTPNYCRYHYSKYPAIKTHRVRLFSEFGIAKKVRSHTGPAILCEESRLQAPQDYSNVAESDWKGWKVSANRKEARGISKAPAEDRPVRIKHISKELTSDKKKKALSIWEFWNPSSQLNAYIAPGPSPPVLKKAGDQFINTSTQITTDTTISSPQFCPYAGPSCWNLKDSY